MIGDCHVGFRESRGAITGSHRRPCRSLRSSNFWGISKCWNSRNGAGVHGGVGPNNLVALRLTSFQPVTIVLAAFALLQPFWDLEQSEASGCGVLTWAFNPKVPGSRPGRPTSVGVPQQGWCRNKQLVLLTDDAGDGLTVLAGTAAGELPPLPVGRPAMSTSASTNTATRTAAATSITVVRRILA